MRASSPISTAPPPSLTGAPVSEGGGAVRLIERYGLLAVCVLGVLPYLNALNAFWVGDDYNYVVPKTLATVLNFGNPLGRAAYRPSNWLTWAIDYTVFGAQPLGWHLTSLALHLANTVLIVLLVRELARAWWPAAPAAWHWMPLLTGAFYAVHPSHPETVTWTGGRADVPFGLGLFLAAWAVARWRTGGRRHPGFYVLAVVGTWLSLLGKEAGLVTPLALLLVDLAIPADPAPATGADLPSPRRGGGGGEVTRILAGAIGNGGLRVAGFLGVFLVPLLVWGNAADEATSPAGVLARLTPLAILLVGVRIPRAAGRAPGEIGGVAGRVATLARDHAPFLAMAAAYALLRVGLFLGGQGRLMYGAETHLQFGPMTLLNSGTAYLLLGLGAWEAPLYVAGWAVWPKVLLALAALGGAAAAVRLLGRPALFAILWMPATVLVTFDAAGDRWFYVPSMGLCLLAALICFQAARVRPLLGAVPALALLLGWSLITLDVNARWVESGQVARGILDQIRRLAPNPPRPATFYMANPPYSFASVLLFNSGFSEAPSYAYQDYTTIRGYELKEHAGQVQAALADPAQMGPHPVFLRYEAGRLVAYPSLRALVDAEARAAP